MSGILSPWLLLLAGFLAGWIVEWLLDIFFFRPRETADLRRQVTRLQAELDKARRSAEHPSQAVSPVLAEAASEGHASTPGQDAAGTELDQAAPQVVEAEVPKVEPAAPEPDAAWDETTGAAEVVEAEVPRVEPAAPEPDATRGETTGAAEVVEAEVPKVEPAAAEPGSTWGETPGAAEVAETDETKE